VQDYEDSGFELPRRPARPADELRADRLAPTSIVAASFVPARIALANLRPAGIMAGWLRSASFVSGRSDWGSSMG
jgi:hypothetical protein